MFIEPGRVIYRGHRKYLDKTHEYRKKTISKSVLFKKGIRFETPENGTEPLIKTWDDYERDSTLAERTKKAVNGCKSFSRFGQLPYAELIGRPVDLMHCANNIFKDTLSLDNPHSSEKPNRSVHGCTLDREIGKEFEMSNSN